jgi:hypothetical protein
MVVLAMRFLDFIRERRLVGETGEPFFGRQVLFSINVIDHLLMLLKVCRLIVCKALIFRDGYSKAIWTKGPRNKNKEGDIARGIS